MDLSLEALFNDAWETVMIFIEEKWERATEESKLRRQ